MKSLRLTFPLLIAAMILAAFLAWMRPPMPAVAQTPTIYHVWKKQVTCINVLNSNGEVTDSDQYMGSVEPGIVYTWSYSQTLPDGAGSNKIEEWFTVCGYGVPDESPTFSYALTSYGNGGYLLSTDYDVNWVDGLYVSDVDAGGSSYGGGTAGCREYGGGITDTVVMTPTAARWGYQLYTRIFVNESFCSSPTYAYASVWFLFGETEPEPEPVLTCAGGAGLEVLQDGPILMPPYSAWEGTYLSGTLPFERAWVTYVYSDPSNDNAPIQVTGEFNGRQTHVREWGAYQEVRNLSVPNRTDPYHKDPYGGGYTYDPYGGVTIPPINLRFATVSELYLMSVCIQEAPRPLTPSLLCPDGLEVLTEPVMAGDYAGLVYEDRVAITATHIAVRYVLENPYFPVERLGGTLMVAPEINTRPFLVEGTWRGRQMVTYTLPTTGAIALPSENVRLAFRNEGPQLKILSICVLDATEIMPQLREDECHLVNPDFVQGLGGWATSGSVSWDGDTGNGAVNEDNGGMVWQAPIQNTGTVWKIELRARAVGAVSGTLMAGTDTDAMIAGGSQMYTVDLVEGWGLYTVDVFVEEQSPRLPGGVVIAAGDNAQVDYMCLSSPDDALPVGECERPTWNPAGSGDPLYIYLFKYLADWIMYGICLVIRAISIAYNGIVRFLENVVLRIPNLDPSDGLLGIPDWINALVFRMLDWLGTQFSNLFAWMGSVLVDFGWFLWEIVKGFITFLGDLLGVDLFFLLQDLDALWDDMLYFWDEIQAEMGLEMSSGMLLLQNLGNVLIVLINGVRDGLTSESVAYLGTDFDGVGAFLWEGVNFVNTALADTPLVALNVIALAAITLALMQWTLKKFSETLEFLS